jgi:hypothetical protein
LFWCEWPTSPFHRGGCLVSARNTSTFVNDDIVRTSFTPPSEELLQSPLERDAAAQLDRA